MSRWKWGKLVNHMLDVSKTDRNESICWVTGRRGLSITNDPNRVTCKFCKKILEDKKDVDED